MLGPWKGEGSGPYKRESLFILYEPINLKHLSRGTAFSHLQHSYHGDQAEVTGEQEHDL